VNAEREDFPPEWIADAERQGVDPARFAQSAAGETQLVLWREIGAVSAVEFAWAMHRAPPLGLLPPSTFAVERVKALRRARSRLARVSDSTWQQLVTDAMPLFLAQSMIDDHAISEAVARRITATEELATARTHPERVVSGLTQSAIKRAAAAVRVRTDQRPSRPEVAAELHTSEATLYRAMRQLGMPKWPPGPPDD
jgi:hypothetical protein